MFYQGSFPPKITKENIRKENVNDRKDYVNIMSYLMCLHMNGPICQTKKKLLG